MKFLELRKYITSGVAVVLLLAAVSVLGWRVVQYVSGRQPVNFPHASALCHVALHVPCAACHTGIVGGTHAGLPKLAVCALCHDPDRKDGPKCPPALAAALKSGTEIPWKQHSRAPKHVYFSHYRHAVLGALNCAECHPDVTRLESPPPPPWRNPVRMAKCIACHRAKHASTDCLGCHR